MARSDPQVNLRIPEYLKLALEQDAAAAKRSLTAEIVARLQFSYALSPDAHEVLDTNARLNTENAALSNAVAAQQKVITILGMYVNNLAQRVQSDDPLTASLMRHLADLGAALEKGDMREAGAPLLDVISLGVKSGTLLPEVLEGATAKAAALAGPAPKNDDSAPRPPRKTASKRK